jgi:hypothetical protein
MKSQAGRHVLQTNAVWTAGVRSVVVDGSAVPPSEWALPEGSLPDWSRAEWSRSEWSPSEWSRTATTRTGGARHVAEPSEAAAPLTPSEAQPLPHRAELVRWAHTVIALLAHPHPHRAPKAPLTRGEHVALAQHEAAREARERTAYRDFALGRPIR